MRGATRSYFQIQRGINRRKASSQTHDWRNVLSTKRGSVKMTLKTATATFKQLLAEITLQLMICALRCGPSQRDFSILSFVQRWGNVDGWMRSSVFSQTLYSCWSARWDNSLFKQTYAASIRSVSTKQASSGCAAVTHRPFVPSFTMWLHEINVSAYRLPTFGYCTDQL